jgi:8-hydroxy-5-deazaflavin:NADPH oxidoreductase
MKVAIIGSGNVGKALAEAATRAGHKVTIVSRSHEKAQEAAKASNAQAAHSTKEAVKDAELVVFAVPADKVDEVVGALSSDLDGKVIIDVTNRVNSRDPGQVLDGSSVAERIQKKAPKAHVMKAFNYAFASRMAQPTIDGTKLDGYVAGDDEAAKQKTLKFVESIASAPSTPVPYPWHGHSRGWACSTSCSRSSTDGRGRVAGR